MKKKRTGAATNIIVPLDPLRKNTKMTVSPNSRLIIAKGLCVLLPAMNAIHPNKGVSCHSQVSGSI